MIDLNEEARRIFFTALEQIDIAAVLNKKIKVREGVLELGGRRLQLADYQEIVMIGMGKASMTMGAALESLLGQRLTRGILVGEREHNIPLRSEFLVGGHPFPDANSLEAGQRIVETVRSCGPGSLIIFLISGGGSALVEAPLLPEISLEDLRVLNRILINSGANIQEINTIRKHLSAVKGGRLGYLARGSTCVGLYVSDVNLGDVQSIASNPLLPDQSILEDFQKVIERYDLLDRLPVSVASLIAERRVQSLPGEWREAGSEQISILLLHNEDAVQAAAEEARRRGFLVEVDTANDEGNYRDVADSLLAKLLGLQRRFPEEAVCLVSGGEVSCPVAEGGRGGRNQQFVLYCAARLADLNAGVNAAVLCCGTDGVDGNSHAAGAVACADLARAAGRQGLDLAPSIQANDSHSFLKQAGGLVLTGPTGNNVRDLRIMLAAAQPSA